MATVINIDDTRLNRSRQLAEEARRYSPGGVQGAGKFYEPYPVFIERAFGSRIWDVDGNEYIDYVGSFGPAVLGVSEGRVCGAVERAMKEEGLIVALPHPREVALASKLCEVIPYGEHVTLHGGGGSDAIYNALRLARAYTGKERILKFEGDYHGWHDDVAISVRPSPEEAGPFEAPNSVPMSAGTLPEHVRNCLVAQINDRAMVEKIVENHHDEIAAIIVEPVVHSSGCIKLEDGFLKLLRELCDTHGIVLIFDEVVTGFRHALSGAGAQQGVYPDIGAFGKAMANGFVLSALIGRRELMSMFTPSGRVLYSGTFNANLIGVVAAQETIRILETEPVHEKLYRLGQLMSDGINRVITKHGIEAVCYNYGSVWCLYFGVKEVRNYRDIIQTAHTKEAPVNVAYRRYLLQRGIFMQPYFTNRGFISYAHSEDDVVRTVDTTEKFVIEHSSLLR